jgi:hypothetical protein
MTTGGREAQEDLERVITIAIVSYRVSDQFIKWMQLTSTTGSP